MRKYLIAFGSRFSRVWWKILVRGLGGLPAKLRGGLPAKLRWVLRTNIIAPGNFRQPHVTRYIPLIFFIIIPHIFESRIGKI